MLVNDSNDGHTHFANQQILTCAQTIHWLRRARKGHRLQKGWEFSIEYLNCYSVLLLCTDLFDKNQPPNFWTFFWHRPHLKSLLCLGRSCFCQLGASCLLLVVISCWLWTVIIGWYLLTPSFVHWLISIGCWWCLLLTTSRSQFTRWSDDLTDGSLVLSHIEVDQSHLADYAEH